MAIVVAAWVGALVGYVIGAMLATAKMRERVNTAERRAHELLLEHEMRARDIREFLE